MSLPNTPQFYNEIHTAMVNTITVQLEAEHAKDLAIEVAAAIATFISDPPDTPYQEAYLACLWKLLRRKMDDEGL